MAKSAESPVFRGLELFRNRRNGWTLIGCQLGGEFGAGAHAELAVDLREVPLHGLGTYEESVRDFAVCVSGCHERGNTLLRRRERAGGSGDSPADPRQFRTSPLGPQLRAEPIEHTKSFCQRFPRGPLLATPALQCSQDEKRAPALEWLLELLVQLERAVEARVRGIEVARGGTKEPSATACDRQRPDALQRVALLLQFVQEGGRFLMLADCKQGLDGVAVEAEQRGFAKARFGNGARERAQKAMRLSCVAKGELEEAAGREHLKVGWYDPYRERKRQPFLGSGTHFGHASEVGVDERLDIQCVRSLVLLACLHRRVEALIGMADRELPVAGQTLDASEVVDNVGEGVLVAVRERTPPKLSEYRAGAVEIASPFEQHPLNPGGPHTAELRPPLILGVEFDSALDHFRRNSAPLNGFEEGHIRKRARQHRALTETLGHLERRTRVWLR